MSDTNSIKKIDLNKTDWRTSRDFFQSLEDELRKLDEKDEKYDFTWVGKRKAILEAGAPINKTLRPDKKSSKNWNTTQNLFIEGDNLDALKLLQESYLGKIKMIYIDPPYNTGKDFVYHDNFRVSMEEYDESTEYKDEEGNIQYKKNEKSNGRYHSDWLSMMYPRLKLARNLLSDDGVIFISIDDNEQANLKKLCDEIFGENSFVACLTVELSLTQGMKVASAQNGKIVKNIEYVLVYSKAESNWLAKTVLYDSGDLSYDSHFSYYLKENGANFEIHSIEELINEEAKIKKYFDKFQLSISFKSFQELIESVSEFRLMIYKEYANKLYQSMGANINIPNEVKRKLDIQGVTKYDKYILHKVGSGNICQLSPLSANVGFTDDYKPIFGRRRIRGDLWKGFYSDMMNVAKEGDTDFKNGKKPVRLIKQLAKIATTKSDLILDFFSGSSTAAHAVMELNAEDGGDRKWIMVQLQEATPEGSEARKAGYSTIPEIARERIKRAGDKIVKEHPESNVDYGFRSLVIADTNYKEVYKPVSEYKQESLLDGVDNIKEDRTDLDLLFGVLTQLALELNRPIETREIEGSTVYLYDYLGEVSGIVACFSDKVSDDAIKQIAKLKPLTAVFKDSSFEDSQAKVNLAEHFRVLSPDTKVRVI